MAHSGPKRESQSFCPREGGILRKSRAGLAKELGAKWWNYWREKPKKFSPAHERDGFEAVSSLWIGLLEILELVSLYRNQSPRAQ